MRTEKLWMEKIGGILMFKYIISYDGGQLRDSGDFEWGLFNSYGEAVKGTIKLSDMADTDFVA